MGSIGYWSTRTWKLVCLCFFLLLVETRAASLIHSLYTIRSCYRWKLVRNALRQRLFAFKSPAKLGTAEYLVRGKRWRLAIRSRATKTSSHLASTWIDDNNPKWRRLESVKLTRVGWISVRARPSCCWSFYFIFCFPFQKFIIRIFWLARFVSFVFFSPLFFFGDRDVKTIWIASSNGRKQTKKIKLERPIGNKKLCRWRSREMRNWQQQQQQQAPPFRH